MKDKLNLPIRQQTAVGCLAGWLAGFLAIDETKAAAAAAPVSTKLKDRQSNLENERDLIIINY